MHRYVHRTGVGVLGWRQASGAAVAATLAPRDSHRRVVSRGRVVRVASGHTTAVVGISRPSSDILTTGWTGNPDNVNKYNNIDEVSASDTDYITSPTITGGEAITFGLSSSLATGTWDVRYRANFVGSSAQVRVHLLDSSDVSQGVSTWQTVTDTFALYTANITTTGTATRVKIEVQ
jgi:hypothetical protein